MGSNNTSILLTGASGFAGAHMLKFLLENTDSFIYCPVTYEHGGHRNRISSLVNAEFNNRFELFELDLAKDSLSGSFDDRNLKLIINFASESHVDRSITDPVHFVSNNVNLMTNILEFTRNHINRVQLIHISTDEVYGDVSDGEHTEKDLLKPSNPYSATKAAADMLILAWARTYKINYIIVRPTNNYGIGQYVEKLIPKACKFLKLGRKIPLHNNGTPIRNWLHAEDTANAIIKIIESNVKNEIYNIAGGFEQSNLDTVIKILEIYLNKKDFNLLDYVDFSYSRQGQDVRYALDDTKLRNLKWKSEKHFNQEIKDIVNYYNDKFIW